MFYDGITVRLQSRTGRDCTSAFPELVPDISAREAVLDGEVTVITNGRPDFEAVMQRYLSSSAKANKTAWKAPVFYVVWDILWNDGKSTMDLPLTDRKRILAGVLGDKNGISKIDWVDQRGIDLWHSVRELKLEGMVAKKKNSYYTPGRRSAAWIKIKNYQELVVNVFGYSKKDGGILVGGDRIQGHAIGMNPDERAVLKKLLDRYGKVEGHAIYLPSGIKGRVKFTSWTAKDNMRDCIWVGFDT
ncbi:MAG: ATP dependent DNA ligase [Desulfotomaculum sp. 46_296]|nr:MAG: ATP dependent DNA ligase [Desulfotomaculum sp. 46_296]